MLIIFSVCSFVYALFYMIIMISDVKINYIEDIISLNIQKIKESEKIPVDTEQESIESINKNYHIEQVQ